MTDRLSHHSPSSVWPGQGANGSEMLKLYIVDPVKVKAMNEKYPAVAMPCHIFRWQTRFDIHGIVHDCNAIIK